MRRLILACCLPLAACGPEPVTVIPPDLLVPCPGWTGPTPATQGELLRAGLAERTGRLCANEKLVSIGEIVGWQ